MDTTTEETQIVFIRQKAGVEDLLFGFGNVQQIREGENVVVTMLNADSIPYDSTRSIKDALDELFSKVGGN